MANAFNICALGQYWRESFTSDEDSGTLIQDPAWLTAVNSISLAFGLAGNASLLLNMSSTLSFNVAQPITVTGFCGAALILIGLVAEASTPGFHPSGVPGSALTQAYYYAIFAAAIYFIVGCLMIVTISGALAKRYDHEFSLTPSQRTLMLQTIMFLGYLMVGALIFSKVEGWNYLDAVYWADFTLLTIGLGAPFVPITHTGRSLLFVYAIGGVVAVGLVIGSIRSMVLEQGKQKIFARLTEKRREKVAQRATVAVKANKEQWQKLPPTHVRKLEFHAMKQIQREVLMHAKWRALLVSLIATALLWFVGALVFQHAEYAQGWTYFESIYFAFEVLTTIGYGDFTPSSNSGKAFFVFWTLLAVPTLTIFISDMGETVVKGIAAATDFLGQITILPQREGFMSAFRAKKSVIKPIRHFVSKHPDMSRLTRDLEHDSLGVAHNDSDDSVFASVMKRRLSDDEVFHCKALGELTDQPQQARDSHFYRWLLAREINMVQNDTKMPDVKEYTYDEWVYFLALLGHNEETMDSVQRAPTFKPRRTATGYKLGKIIDHLGNIRDWR